MDLSLLSQTDVFTMRPLTELTDRGPYAVFRTPAAPNYYSGNSLLLGVPLTLATLATWAGVFAEEFAGTPVQHVRVEWTGPDPTPAEVAAYAAAGFQCQTTLCMVRPHADFGFAILDFGADTPGTSSGTPKSQIQNPKSKISAGLAIHPLVEADAGRLKRFLLDCHADWGAPFIDFTVANILLRQQTLEGGWWLGWLDGQIAGSMGLFFAGDRGRFQLVDTHPAYRRRGVARALLTHLIGQGFARPQTTQLVIAADRDYFAAGFYAACGFRPVHTQHEALKHPDDELRTED